MVDTIDFGGKRMAAGHRSTLETYSVGLPIRQGFGRDSVRFGSVRFGRDSVRFGRDTEKYSKGIPRDMEGYRVQGPPWSPLGISLQTADPPILYVFL